MLSGSNSPSTVHGKTTGENRAKVPTVLSKQTLLEGVKYLGAKDSDLGHLFSQAGPPPLWEREPGFPTLVLIILEQQVSLASARATFRKVNQAANPLTPDGFLRYSDGELRTMGFSRQKTAYCRDLARAIGNGELYLPDLEVMDDFGARSRLMVIKGVGPWTADIYLLRAMLRPDIWPSADLALAKAVQEVKGLASRPNPDELEDIAEGWRPWRAVAARALWQFYLSRRK